MLVGVSIAAVALQLGGRANKRRRCPALQTSQYLSGTFHADGGSQFWNANGFENIVVIELIDEHFERLVLSLDNPQQRVTKIDKHATE